MTDKLHEMSVSQLCHVCHRLNVTVHSYTSERIFQYIQYVHDVNDQSTFSVVHRESADIYTQCISMSDESNELTSVLYLV